MAQRPRRLLLASAADWSTNRCAAIERSGGSRRPANVPEGDRHSPVTCGAAFIAGGGRRGKPRERWRPNRRLGRTAQARVRGRLQKKGRLSTCLFLSQLSCFTSVAQIILLPAALRRTASHPLSSLASRHRACGWYWPPSAPTVRRQRLRPLCRRR
jgi:hypothetical protein